MRIPQITSALISCALFSSIIAHAQTAAANSSDLATQLEAARHANHDAAKRTLSDMAKQPILTAKDTASVYEAMKLAGENLSDGKDLDQDASWGRLIHALSRQLAGSGSPEQQQLLLNFLAAEVDLIAGDSTSRNALPAGARLKETVRIKRFEGVIDALSAAQNPGALPLLRRVVKEHPNTLEAKDAENAIGKIGDPNDLQTRIEQLKANPGTRMDLGKFGPMLIQPLVREISNPNLSKQQRGVLLNALGQARSHNAVNEYAKLLSNPDSEIQKVAAVRIAGYATHEDDALVRNMLQSKSMQVRYSAVNAIGQQLFEDQFVPDLILILRNDPDDMVRALAASTLGEHHVKTAEHPLQEAQADKSNKVRQSADYALKRIRDEVRY